MITLVSSVNKRKLVLEAKREINSEGVRSIKICASVDISDWD